MVKMIGSDSSFFIICNQICIMLAKLIQIQVSYLVLMVARLDTLDKLLFAPFDKLGKLRMWYLDLHI
jgi:hypothetical protein